MQAINHTLRLAAATALTMVLGGYLYSVSADAAEGRDISRVNGAITVEAGEQVGDISLVNGSINLGRGANASEVTTVNGALELADRVSIDDANTVNGAIRVGAEVTVRGSLETVNGGIQTDAGTVIERGVTTVNGRIRLNSTEVGENIETTNGDISIRHGSVVSGDVVVRGRHRWWNRLFTWNRQRPEITIDDSSRVQGDIHIYRPVDLDIADGSLGGTVIEHF